MYYWTIYNQSCLEQKKDPNGHKKATKVNDSKIKYYILIYKVCDKSKKLEAKRAQKKQKDENLRTHLQLM